jgi:hypothetical protein
MRKNVLEATEIVPSVFPLDGEGRLALHRTRATARQSGSLFLVCACIHRGGIPAWSTNGSHKVPWYMVVGREMSWGRVLFDHHCCVRDKLADSFTSRVYEQSLAETCGNRDDYRKAIQGCNHHKLQKDHQQQRRAQHIHARTRAVQTRAILKHRAYI